MPQILFFQNPSPHDLKSKVSVFQNVMQFHHFLSYFFDGQDALIKETIVIIYVSYIRCHNHIVVETRPRQLFTLIHL